VLVSVVVVIVLVIALQVSLQVIICFDWASFFSFFLLIREYIFVYAYIVYIQEEGRPMGPAELKLFLLYGATTHFVSNNENCQLLKEKNSFLQG
jgi:hypothetical protein